MPPLRTTSLAGRLGAVLPDLITVGLFAFAWCFPLAVDGLVRSLALVMIVEFFLILATGFFSVYTLVSDSGRQQTFILVGAAAFYLLFIGVNALIFGEWWPVLVFVWLLVGKLPWLRLPADARERLLFPAVMVWAASVLIYLLAVIVPLLLPMPEFGIASEIVPRLGMEGEGEWMERPQTVVAAGMMHFFLLALLKHYLHVQDLYLNR